MTKNEIREREARTGLLIRMVDVNRTRTPQAMLKATGCVPYVDSDVVTTMPKGESDKVELCFFQVPGNPSDDDLASAYDLRGLAPADPFALGDFNAANREFADKHSNATHWKNADGRYCGVVFDYWNGKRGVSVYRNDGGGKWCGYWWFAGVRKSTLSTTVE